MNRPFALCPLTILFATTFTITSASAETRLYSLSGIELQTCAIRSATALGDVNSDGYPEILLGGLTYCTINGLNDIAVAEAKHGKVLFRVHSDQVGDWEGSAISSIGDVDGDAKPDIITGAPLYDISGSIDQGRVRVLSGASGSLLRTWTGRTARSNFGSSVASLGVINGKEHAIACAYNGNGSIGAADNYCDIYNVTDNALLYSLTGTPTDGLGGAVVRLPDLTGDGISEFVVSRPLIQNLTGRIELRRSQDGQLLASLSGTPNSQFGKQMWVLGRDITGAPLVGVTTNLAYGVNIYRVSATGFTLAFSRSYGSPAITAMSETSDYNGDGENDIAIGLPYVQSSNGIVEIVSKQGALIRTLNGAGLARLFGFAIANLGDINGDGVTELGIVSNEQAQGNSSLNVYSSKDKSSTINQCNHSPGDTFSLTGTVRPGGSVVFSGHAAGAINSHIFLNFSSVNWYYSAPLDWAFEPRFPGCRTNLDGGTLTTGVSIPTDASGNFQYTWNVPNVPSAVGMQLRVSALTVNTTGQLQLFNEIVFKIAP